MERIPLKHNATGQGLILTSMAMLALGAVMVHSAIASLNNPRPFFESVDVRHTFFAVAALAVLVTFWRIDYRVFAWRGRFPLLVGGLLALSMVCAALVYVKGIGHTVGTDARWIRLGFIQFQPSEMVKFSLVLFLASWLSRETTNVRSYFKTFVPAAALIGICVMLVIKEDFSTGALVALVASVTLFLAGTPIWHFLTLLPPSAAAVYMLVIHTPHRMARLVAFLDPWDLTNDSTYQPRQALLAILNGGWTGMGPGGGSIKYGYLPEDTTDFIFAIFCEEWGAIGAMLLIGLVGMYAWHARKAAINAPDRFGQLMVSSLSVVILGAALMHMGVVTAVLPVTGQGFPFVSAGGTALLMTAAATALMVSVSARKLEGDESLSVAGAMTPKLASTK